AEVMESSEIELLPQDETTLTDASPPAGIAAIAAEKSAATKAAAGQKKSATKSGPVAMAIAAAESMASEGTPVRTVRMTPGPSLPSLVALSSSATVPPPSKVVPVPPTTSPDDGIPTPPVASDILASIGRAKGPGFGSAPIPEASTAFPGAIN